jgi:ribonuclease III
MESIEAEIGYQFTDPALLLEALTHPSLAYETKKSQADNQRLEYLGDAVIQLILTNELFRQFPKYSEGQLTKIRSRLVSREALCGFANEIQLGKYLRLGKGELSNGGKERPSNLADAFEALMGAIYIDTGFVAARKFLFDNLGHLIQATLDRPEEVNPKGQLQEILQAITPSSPTYRLISQEGPDHLRKFLIEVKWEGLTLGRGSGNSKKEAETAAAVEALRERKWEEKTEAPDPEKLCE